MYVEVFDFFSPRCFPVGPGHVLIAAYDERTCSQLREVCNKPLILNTLRDRAVWVRALAGIHAAVFLGKTLSQCLSPPRCINHP